MRNDPREKRLAFDLQSVETESNRGSLAVIWGNGFFHRLTNLLNELRFALGLGRPKRDDRSYQQIIKLNLNRFGWKLPLNDHLVDKHGR